MKVNFLLDERQELPCCLLFSSVWRRVLDALQDASWHAFFY